MIDPAAPGVPEERWNLRLYVAGQTDKSIRAIRNLNRICTEHLNGHYTIEVIDLMERPQLAEGDQILAIPTLVRRLPEPIENHRRPVERRARLDRTRHSSARKGMNGIAGSAMSDVRYALTLFITGITPRSLRAVANVRAFCEGEMNGSYDLEIVDLYEHPERAQPANVVVSPTLVRSLPHPVRLLFGDMSDRQQLCAVLKVA